MKVLGIETATSVCAAAVAVDGRVIAEALVDRRNVHAEKLLSLIDSVLLQTRQRVAEMDAVAVSIGPGSFTGLRIGLSVAKGLVFGTGKVLIAVPTLEALAVKAVEADIMPRPSFVLAMLDARRDDVYCQVFRLQDNEVEPVGGVRDLMLAELPAEVGERDVAVMGDANVKLARQMEQWPTTVRGRFRVLDGETARCSAGPVAQIGGRLLQGGKTQEVATLEPLYIKDFFLHPR